MKQILFLFILTIVSLNACKNLKQASSTINHSISRDIALEISRNEFQLLGYNLNVSIMKIDSHVITIDSIMSNRVPCSWSNVSAWYEQVHSSLANKSFWRTHCFTRDVLDSDMEIYIDSNTGRVLYIYPLGNPEDLSIKRGRP